MNKNIVVYYDGNCALCHGLVQFALRRDSRKRIFFAPIQGETYASKFGQFLGEPQTVIVEQADQKLMTHSDAIIEILCNLGPIWPTLGKLLKLVPKTIRDAGYKWTSKNRVRFFGRTNSSCPRAPSEFISQLLP